MPEMVAARKAAQLDGDFVVFLIGMRINSPWKVGKWWPVLSAMPKMIAELAKAGPETGFLGYTSLGFFSMVQYWRSFEHLEAYARSQSHSHWPAWVSFNRAMKNSRGDVGIWHETYLIRAGQYETLYSGMPRQGLGRAGRLVDAVGKREAAAGRLAGEGS